MAFRHKSVEKCCMGALAFCMFSRYHMTNEEWPPFQDRERCYKTKLLCNKNDPFKAITQQGHIRICKNTFEETNCKILKGRSTHVGRKEGCKLADMMDVPDSQLRRLGRWDHTRMIQHYSTQLPKQAARIIAGHGPDQG